MIRQLNVFMENKLGRLYEICNLLGENGINIRGFSVADMADYGILRLIVSDPDKARKILLEANFPVSESKVIVVSVPDKPGGLAGVLKVLADAGIGVEYTYIIANTKVAFSCDDNAKAEEALARVGFELVSEEQIMNI
jgi:hypothetical protein